MKMCRLEEVECELRGAGCGGRFLREDQEEHARQNSQKHLTLTASLAMETKEQLQQKLLELDQRHKEEEEKLKKKIEEQLKEHKKKLEKQEKKLEKLREQEKKLGEQEKKLLGEQEKKLREQEKKLGEQEKKLREQEKKLGEQEKKLEEQEKKLGEQEKKLGEQEKKLGEHDKTSQLEKEFRVELGRELQELKKTFQDFEQKVSSTVYLHRRFEMRNFSAEKKKDEVNDWKSPAMYTHLGGYKFCVGVDANGYHSGHGKSIYVDLWFMLGEFDDQLKWPAKAKFTIELINQQGGQNESSICQAVWNKPIYIDNSVSVKPLGHGFLDHINLWLFLNNDTLSFNVCVKVL